MNKMIKRISILLGIFVGSVTICFVLYQNTMEKSDIVYTTMEEATLPVVYPDMFGTEMGGLHGHMQELGQSAVREPLVILPQDRQLGIRIAEYGQSIQSVKYEIRSMDLSRLVERTTVEEWVSQGGNTDAVLPIQNLLSKDTQYLLDLCVETKTHGTIHYYTRIMWTENDYIKDMLDLAEDFSRKTFDYDQARDLVTYLETDDKEDNSSLGRVTIRSSFAQLTWAGLDMQLEGAMDVTLKEMDGIMANIQVDYLASRLDSEGNKEYYEVSDNFSMKWNTKRIYLMEFNRETNQIFMGNKSLFSGKRIMLGITNDGQVSTEKSPNGRYLAFRTNRDLWSFDQKEEHAVKVFSFRSGTDDSLRSNHDKHDIQVVNVSDNGDIDFLVYGYMNRGKHEGYVGVGMYRYEVESDAIEENFFIPVQATFEELSMDIAQLTFLGGTEMLYLYLDQAVYGIDLKSNEYIVVADGLKPGNYAISDDGKILVWQDGIESYQSKKLHMMNLETGQKVELTNPDGAVMRVLGFVNGDLIYGLAREEDLWIVNGRVEELPMYALEIIDSQQNLQTRYQEPGRYLSGIEVDESRIHMDCLRKNGDSDYIFEMKDTIVCNVGGTEDALEGIGWFASSERRKLYFVQADNEIKNSKSIRVSTPRKITYDKTEDIMLQPNTTVNLMQFYAYGGGKLLGKTEDFSEAIALSYEQMGYVTDITGRILWDRINRNTSHTISDPSNTAYRLTYYLDEFTENKIYSDNTLILDARGCTLNQMLYFIDRGCPVVAYVGNSQYLLLYGFDQHNVSVYNPYTKETSKMGLGDAGFFFENLGNDFVCALFIQ